MSIAGYLSKRNTVELRMPKSDESGKPCNDGPAIRFEGPVMRGEKSVRQEQRDVAIRATSHRGESYSTIEDYDPVLRAHCRL
jgi:hypothetical protein